MTKYAQPNVKTRSLGVSTLYTRTRFSPKVVKETLTPIHSIKINIEPLTAGCFSQSLKFRFAEFALSCGPCNTHLSRHRGVDSDASVALRVHTANETAPIRNTCMPRGEQSRGRGVIEPARKRRSTRPVQRPASHCPTVEGANGRAQAAARRRVSHTSEKARQCDVSLRGVSAAQRRAALRISLGARETGSAPASKKTQASPASDRWGGFRSQGHHVWGLPRLLTDGVKTVSGNGGDERVRLACRHRGGAWNIQPRSKRHAQK